MPPGQRYTTLPRRVDAAGHHGFTRVRAFMPIDRDPHSPAVRASSPASVDAVARATGAALQADTARALAILARVDADEFVGDDLAFRSSMLERFGPNRSEQGLVDPVEPFAREMLATYRTYWRAALARPGERAREETTLLHTLQHLTAREDVADYDAMEPIVTARLGNAGYHCLQGLTGPLRELMLWTQQDMRSYKVMLPDGEHTTRVFVLDRFASLGWSDFATCGRRGTGGWATGDALYAVVPRYSSLDGEEFQVSFLGHETQHFADLTRFAPMPQWEARVSRQAGRALEGAAHAAEGPAQAQRRSGGRPGGTACLRQQARARGARATAAFAGRFASRRGRRRSPAERGCRRAQGGHMEAARHSSGEWDRRPRGSLGPMSRLRRLDIWMNRLR